MPKLIDLTGQKFTRLTVISRAKNAGIATRWNCICDCGELTIATGDNLRRKHSKSCGCYRADRPTTHGMSKTNIYKIWTAMKQRCENKDDSQYCNYGERGISVCERWHSFENFFSDMGHRPDGKSIDRINNDRGYSADNCEWRTQINQMNNMRKNVHITYNNETLTISQWTRKAGMNKSTFYNRHNSGWSIERILTTPVRHCKSPT